MRGLVTSVFAVVVVAFFVSMFPQEALAADAPADRVVVMYFHRTQRCPTCLKMGGYSEEAVKTGFAQELKDGTVGFHYVDFQDPRNAALAKAYRINGPALIIARVANNKVVEFTNLKDIWTKVADKPAFLRYVQDNVAAYSAPRGHEHVQRNVGTGDAPRSRVVAMYFHRTKRCPTCLKMGSYSEEAVTTGFAQQLQNGTVGFYYVDFQDPRNTALAKRFAISGPALVVAKVVDNEVVDARNLTDIWTKVADKRAFLAYVQENVAAYSKADSPGNRPQDDRRTANRRAR